MAERFVGRAQELAVLEQTLVELSEGPRAVALSGESGIGKTRLLVELERRARQRGNLVLVGRASELESDLPYWAFVNALDDYLRSLASNRIERLGERLVGELARIFPALAGLGERFETVLDERYIAHDAVRDVLERIAAAEPLILVLDDLHWADPASIELLSGLLHRPPEARVLIALALRPRQAPARLTAALEQVARAGALRRLELDPLSEAEAKTLLGQSVRPHVFRALYQESGGNPFYLQQLARAWRRTPRALAGARMPPVDATTMLGEAEAPPAVAAALAEELNLLSPRAGWLLEGAAVVGDPFEVELAAVAAGESDEKAFQAVDELLSVDLLRRTDAPRRFRFRHPLVRHAVYAGTQEGWRLAAHGRVAQALAARGEPVTARAHHVAYCARRGDRQAVALLREAADASAQRAPASAARWYRAALDLLPEGEAREQRVAILDLLARSHACLPARDNSPTAERRSWNCLSSFLPR